MKPMNMGLKFLTLWLCSLNAKESSEWSETIMRFAGLK